MKTSLKFTSLCMSGVLLLTGCAISEEPVTSAPAEKPKDSNITKEKVPQLTPEEKVAIEFVRAGLIYNDVAKVDALSDGDEIRPEAYIDHDYVKPGSVKVTSHDMEFDMRKVVIFVPLALCDLGNRIEIELEKINGKWMVVEENIAGAPVVNFSEFQLDEYWSEKGHLLEWKDAKL